MAAPSNSKYILSELDPQLPNGRVLTGQNSISVTTATGETEVAIEAGKLKDFLDISTQGIVVKTDDDDFVTRTLVAGNASIDISGNISLGATPTMFAPDGKTLQKIYVTSNNASPSTSSSTLNFFEGNDCTIELQDGSPGEVNIIVSSSGSTAISSFEVEIPTGYPTQVFEMTPSSFANGLILSLDVNLDTVTEGQILFSKPFPNPGAVFDDKPQGLKSFDMTSLTNLLDVTFNPNNKPSDPGDELTVTIAATNTPLADRAFKYNGTTVVYDTVPSSPIASLSFDLVAHPSSVLTFNPITLTNANDENPVILGFDTSGAASDGLVFAAYDPNNSTPIQTTFMTGVKSAGLTLDSNISNVFTVTNSPITDSEQLTFGFNTATASNNQLPYWNGTDLVWTSVGSGDITSVTMSVNANSTNILQVTGPSSITNAGTYLYGYNFTSTTPPSSAVRFTGTNVEFKHPQNSALTIVSAGQAQFPSTGSPTLTIYSGANASSGNVFFVKACGFNGDGRTPTEGRLTSQIYGANPTNVIINSTDATDLSKWFTYIVYYLTPAS